MSVLAVILKEVTKSVFSSLIAVFIDETGMDAALREKIRQRLGKKSPEQLAFRLALERALSKLEKEHPGWVQSLFDEKLLTAEATTRELAQLLPRRGQPDAGVLAEIWARQVSTGRPDR